MRRGRRGRPRGIGSVDELDSLECLVWLEDAQHFVPQLLVQHAQTVRSRLGAIDSGLETGELRQGRDARPRKALLYLKQELHWCIYEVLSEMGSKRRDGRQIEELAVGPPERPEIPGASQRGICHPDHRQATSGGGGASRFARNTEKVPLNHGTFTY